jgi:hypothetical protein
MTDRNPPTVKSATEAREGVTGHNVRYVLIISACGIILLFAGLWLYFFGGYKRAWPQNRRRRRIFR